MSELQSNLFQLLIEFDELCKKYDIDYLLAAGASLGAVRNRCFMPWDDDIDLYITRDNWNKLRSVLESGEDVLPEGRSFVYKENTKYYNNPLPRYINDDTTNIYVSQSFAGKACGQHLELFIFDPMPVGEEAKQEYLKLLHVYTELLSPYFVVNKNASLEDWQEHYELYRQYCKRVDEEGEEKVIKELEATLQQYSPEECDQYCMRWGIKNYIYNKEHFQLESEMGEFEDMQFPIGYYPEGILRVAYGDSWMYIPEYEEQISHNGLKNNDVGFKEYTDIYLKKINRESVFPKYMNNKRNNASVFYNRKKIEMLVAKERVIAESMIFSDYLDSKEDELRSLLENKEYSQLSEEFKDYANIQSNSDVVKFKHKVPISDKNLATFLFGLIEQGKYYQVNKFLSVREHEDVPLSDELIFIKESVQMCRELSIARYDEKDVESVKSLIEKYDEKYPDLLDIYRAKVWIKECEANSQDDFKDIDEFCDEILSIYPFDGEVIAYQARAKLECGDMENAQKLYEKAIFNTRNGLIWQKVEDEIGISRIDIERDLIEELNNEN